MNKRSVGEKNEELAMDHLRLRGYEIIAHGFHVRQGEIDLIARKISENTLCFIEVKYRKTENAGFPEEAVSASKQKRICRAADVFLHLHPEYASFQVRFDVIGILGKDIRHTENAFYYIGSGF